MERVYSDTAVALRKGQIRSAEDLAAALSKSVPTDREFQSAFSVARVSQAYLARYNLNALERTARGQSQPELVPNKDEQALNLEHILPENPSPAWKVDPDPAKAHHKRLGNLTLLKTRINEQIGNQGFDETKKLYAKSELLLTKELETFSAWSPKDIDDRQKHLAELAIMTWPLAI